MNVDELVKKAFEASQNAYVPYSNFRVGAIVMMKDGTIFPGCNIENAAYGSTMCAERNAIFQAYCNGYLKDDIESLTIVSSSQTIVTPCGACRQVLSELLNASTPIYLANQHQVITTSIQQLLPSAFSEENLNV